MALIISDKVLEQAQISADELLVDLACYLYEKKRMSTGQARALVGMNQIEFQKELASRDIDIHYTEEDLEKDLENLGINI
jgi:predicted HTH domain antitoxin